MKVFMGMVNVASLMDDYAQGFKELGHDVFCVHNRNSVIQSSNVDLHIPKILKVKLERESFTKEQAADLNKKLLELAWQKAVEADICFFVWESFMPDASDLRILKKMGKKIVVRFCGSEVRDPDVYYQAKDVTHYPYVEYGLSSSIEEFEKKIQYLRTCESFADLIICPSEMSLRPVGCRQMYLFDSSLYENKTKQNEYPVLLHAPSKSAVKGTDIWLQVFDVLRGAGFKFGTKFIQGLPHEEMPKEYASADIFCDSLFIGGRATWEAMAAGCIPVGVDDSYIVKVRSDFSDNFFQSLELENSKENHALWMKLSGMEDYILKKPGLKVTVDNITDELAKLILDYSRRQKLAEDCYNYATTLLSPVAACQSIIDYIDDPDALDSQLTQVHVPFYNKFYSPENVSQEKLAIMNKYTGLVRHCKWYKKFVSPCERAGLKF